jgi:hypothetical protein
MRILSNQIGRKSPWEQQSSFQKPSYKEECQTRRSHPTTKSHEKTSNPHKTSLFWFIIHLHKFQQVCVNQMVQKPRNCIPSLNS